MVFRSCAAAPFPAPALLEERARFFVGFRFDPPRELILEALGRTSTYYSTPDVLRCCVPSAARVDWCGPWGRERNGQIDLCPRPGGNGGGVYPLLFAFSVSCAFYPIFEISRAKSNSLKARTALLAPRLSSHTATHERIDAGPPDNATPHTPHPKWRAGGPRRSRRLRTRRCWRRGAALR